MTETEEKLLVALAWMAEQYLGDRAGSYLDNQCMCAGERAFEVLASYGLIKDIDGRNAEWTDAGRRFLDSN